MQCDYFDHESCRSCILMGQAYDAQLSELQRTVSRTLGQRCAEDRWQQPGFGPESHFRNKAKLVVGGTRATPTFGILDRGRRGVDLRDCGLYESGLHEAVRQLTDFVTQLGLTPYDVPRRSGELKHVIVTHSPDGESMIRFVLRSPGQLGRIRAALPDLLDAVPSARVVTVNLLPEHKAALEGDEETILTEQQTLPMRLNHITLQLRPRSFFQTNTVVAAQLYRQAQEWISQINPATVLDLFCGVGGFALHAAKSNLTGSIRGVEISQDAVAAANLGASELLGDGSHSDIRFVAGDARAALADGNAADLVVVNPPRRGIGDLAATLEDSGVSHVLYSSCNVTSLASDLEQMSSFRVVHARLFDMFPQTHHHEVLVHLQR